VSTVDVIPGIGELPEFVDVELLHPGVTNREVGNVDDLAASIADLGVLQALVITPDGQGGYEVVCGARRLAGAKQAGKTQVPATIRAFASEQDKLVARACENLVRVDLSPLEEAIAYQEMLDAGLSQRAVAARVSRSQSHISKRLALLALPAAAKAAVNAGGIGVADALELAKLAEHPKRVAEVLKVAKKKGGDVGRAIDMQLRDAEREATRRAAIDEQEAAGVKVLLVDQHYWYGRKERPLGKGYDSIDVTPKAHAPQPCHAAAIDRLGRMQLVCLRPERHPEARPKGSGRGKLSEAEKAERARTRQENKDRRAAQVVRDEALAGLLRKRLPKAAVFELVVTQWLCQRSTNNAHIRFACELLGLAKSAPADRWGHVDHTAPVAEYAAKGPDQLARVALALCFAMAEEPLRRDHPYWQGEGVAEHFAFLEAQGYAPAPIEVAKLGEARPRPAPPADTPDAEASGPGAVGGDVV
jgi:ParB/RepB/Spo0J family partition protein